MPDCYFPTWKCCPDHFVFHKPIEDNLDIDSMNNLYYIANIMNTFVLCCLDLHSFPLSHCTISHIFSSFLLPFLNFNQFSPLCLCPTCNNCYYCPYCLSSRHSLVLILTFFFPFTSWSLFSHSTSSCRCLSLSCNFPYT